VVIHEDLETGPQSLGEGSRFQRLPEDLEEVIGNRVFKDEDALQAALEELKIADEPIVLGEDGRAYYYMPGNVHNDATGHIAVEFTLWSNRVKLYARENTNAVLGDGLAGAPPPRKKKKAINEISGCRIVGEVKVL
jgi:hypothetical protein